MVEKCAASQPPPPPPRGEAEEDQADNTGNTGNTGSTGSTGNAGNAGSKVGKAGKVGKAAVDEEDELPVQLGVHVGDIAYNLDITPRGDDYIGGVAPMASRYGIKARVLLAYVRLSMTCMCVLSIKDRVVYTRVCVETCVCRCVCRCVCGQRHTCSGI